MRIAIVSDIHGNWEALRSLPADYDELWVLGDLVNYGPDPSAVIEFVRAHAAVVVQGNYGATDQDPSPGQTLKQRGGVSEARA